MAEKSAMAMFSLLCFLLAAFYGVFTTQNQLYLQTLWFLIGITIALFTLQIRKFGTSQSHQQKFQSRPVNFNALNRNSKSQLDQCKLLFELAVPMEEPEVTEVQQEQPRQPLKLLDMATRKQKMRNHFQADEEPTAIKQQNSINRQSQGFIDDTRSQMSYAIPLQFPAQPISGRSCYYADIQQQSKKTDKLLSKIVLKVAGAHQTAGALFFTQFLPTFVSEYKDHLVNVNRMMRDNFSQKLIDIDIFFANKPYDINSNKHEKSIGMKSITLEDVFYLKNQMKQRQKEIIIAPNSVEKFARERAEFIKECDLLEVFYESLDMSMLNRNHITDRKSILLKLTDFCENNVKPVYQAEGLPNKFASDYEIFFTVFINTIIQCVRYEKSKYLKEVNSNNLNLLRLVDVSIQQLGSFALKTQSSDLPSRNLFIQQKLEFQNQEPQFHFYSDLLTKQLSDQDKKPLELKNYILYTSRDSNSLNALVCYYLLHLLSISRLQQWQQLQTLEMDQRIIKCLIKMAKDISYLVTIT